MSDLKVKIPIQPMIDLRTEEAEAKLRALDHRLTRASGGTTGVAGDSSSIHAVQKVQSQFGTDFSFLQNRRSLNALIRQEHQSVRDLAEAYERVKHIQTESGKAQADQIRRKMADHKNLAQAMRTMQVVGEDRELLHGHGMSRTGVGPSAQRMQMFLSQMTLSQAVRGGAFMGGAGGFGRMIMSNPWLAGTAAAVGGPVLAYHLANSMSDPSEQIQMQYLNSARRMGGGSMMGQFSTAGNPGRANSRLLGLGFTHADIARSLSAFGMPGSSTGVQGAIEAQMQFARRFGMGDSPEMVAGLGRHMGMMGLPMGQQQGFWKQMAAVNLQGQKLFGVDSQDTTKGMMALLARIADNTGLLTPDRITGAMVVGLRTQMAGRIFQGEQGMQRFSNTMDSFQNPKSIQGQAMINNILMGAFDGKLPDAKNLDLKGTRGEAYDALAPMQQLEFLRQNMTSLPGGIAEKIFMGLDRSVPKSLQPLMFQSMTGLNASQTVEQMAGLGNMAEPGAQRPFQSLAAVFGKDTGDKDREKLLKAMFGGFPDQTLDEASKIEQARARSASIGQEASMAVSQGTLNMRMEIKKGMEEALSTTLVNAFKLFANPEVEIKNGVREGFIEALRAVPFGGFLTDGIKDPARLDPSVP